MNLSAGGDIVGGNKVTTTSIETKSFAGEKEKADFDAKVAELIATVRTMRDELKAQPGLSEDDKEEIEKIVGAQVSVLKEAKQQAAALPVAQPIPTEAVTNLETALEQAGGLPEKLKNTVQKAGGAMATLQKYSSVIGAVAGIAAKFLIPS